VPDFEQALGGYTEKLDFQLKQQMTFAPSPVLHSPFCRLPGMAVMGIRVAFIADPWGTCSNFPSCLAGVRVAIQRRETEMNCQYGI
jgi:hypothetical protein